MSEQSYSIKRDLEEAEAMANGLEDYVRGSDLYGKTGGGFFSRMPSLTIGALLMRLRRLDALRDGMTDSQRQQLEQVKAQHEKIRKEWAIHYHEKLVREAHSRLDSMSHFFEECRDNPRLCASAYPPEALKRTIVQEIADTLENTYGVDSKELPAKLRATDSKLRRYAQAADFQWDAALREVYPQERYWWLYAKPQLPDNA